MSARTRLAADLTAGLPTDKYRVAALASPPDQIDPDTITVRVWCSDLVPGPAAGSLTVGLTVWALTGAADPARVDDLLDAALDDLLTVLHPLEWARWTKAERAVMNDNDGPRWHGYRIDLTAYAAITQED
ncbi:MAG: hypothetical protein KJ792_04190 [Actinobacteria bacterium]|nr:hypothetical protein [Actinomycetota bacterium]